MNKSILMPNGRLHDSCNSIPKTACGRKIPQRAKIIEKPATWAEVTALNAKICHHCYARRHFA